MLISVDHRTSYGYGTEVVLAPHTVRLCPKDDASQKVRSFSLKTDPPEAGRSVNCDLYGTTTVTLWFEGKSSRLVIDTSSVVETLRSNPFDFIVSEMGFLGLPAEYPEELRDCLAPYVAVDEKTAEAVSGICRTIMEKAEGQTTAFITELARHIHDDFEHMVRENGAAWPAERTLAEKRGACRDFVVLFTSVCRSVGLACRLVSGYAISKKAKSENHLHAWAEVYIPGGGWRGYDPTAGIAVSDHHVALATGVTPELIAPVAGSFYGDGAEAKLEFEVNIREIESKKK